LQLPLQGVARPLIGPVRVMGAAAAQAPDFAMREKTGKLRLGPGSLGRFARPYRFRGPMTAAPPNAERVRAKPVRWEKVGVMGVTS
jgi:hypothetical protein